MKINSITLLICILYFCAPVYAQEESLAPSDRVSLLRDQGYQIEYVDDDISLSELARELKENHETTLYFMPLQDYIRTLKRWNRHVRNFNNLNGEYIYTEPPGDPYLDYEYIPKLPLNPSYPQSVATYDPKVNTLKAEKNLDYTEISRTKYTFFAHVTVSQGLFNEQVSTSSLKNQQNSPLTIGAGTHIKFNSSFALATSAYVSKLNVSTVDSPQLSQTNLKVKNEYGANLYGEFRIPNSAYSVYGGVDYEQFNTLNLQAIINGTTDKIEVRREKMTFATIGISFLTKLFLPTAIKISGSPIVQSNHNFTGYKYMLYVNQRMTKNTWYHFLFKHHQLEQSSGQIIAINRYGFGVGVTF